MVHERWVAYVRVSTSEQAHSGLGLAAQEASVRAAVHQGGGELVQLIADEGESGKDMDRPGIMEALALIAAGEADGLVVAKLDRVTRSVADFAALMEWFAAAGAVFRALDLGIDTSSAGGRLVANVFASVAEWERETISARTRDALAAKRAQGGAVSGPSVTIDRPQLAQRIRSRRAGGATYQAIADELNGEDVPTLRGGLRWRVSSVQTAAGYQRRAKRRTPAELPELPRRRRAS